jgi:hypothetical protein
LADLSAEAPKARRVADLSAVALKARRPM